MSSWLRAFSVSVYPTQHTHYMKLALRHAQHAFREKEVPIGAVLVAADGTVISAARNRVEGLKDATAHAEIECLRSAAKLTDNWRLLDCTLYSTLEPCPMCVSALQAFRVKRVVYAAPDKRLGALGSWVDLVGANHPYHKLEIERGICEEESAILIKRFFQMRRRENAEANAGKEEEPATSRGGAFGEGLLSSAEGATTSL